MRKHITLRPSWNNTAGEARDQTFIDVAEADVNGLVEAAKHYGESWYMREGAGAFFMLARKWDRIEKRMKDESWKSIIEVLKADKRAEGMIDDIRDLRRYLMLIEAKLIELGLVHDEVEKGDKVAVGGDLRKKAEPVAILCATCKETFTPGEQGYLCPHTVLEKTETCAKCGGVGPFGVLCPCATAAADPVYRGEDGGFYFTIKGTGYGPFDNIALAREVYADNKVD